MSKCTQSVVGTRRKRGRHFRRGSSRQNAEMKEQRRETVVRGKDESSYQQPSTLFSPPFISLHFPIWPIALHTAFLISIIIRVKPALLLPGTASSQRWSALHFPSAGGGDKHLYPGSPARLHVLIKLSSVRTDSVIITSAIRCSV